MRGSPPRFSAAAPCCSRGARWSSAPPPWPRPGRPWHGCGAVPPDERPRSVSTAAATGPVVLAARRGSVRARLARESDRAPDSRAVQDRGRLRAGGAAPPPPPASPRAGDGRLERCRHACARHRTAARRHGTRPGPKSRDHPAPHLHRRAVGARLPLPPRATGAAPVAVVSRLPWHGRLGVPHPVRRPRHPERPGRGSHSLPLRGRNGGDDLDRHGGTRSSARAGGAGNLPAAVLPVPPVPDAPTPEIYTLSLHGAHRPHAVL